MEPHPTRNPPLARDAAPAALANPAPDAPARARWTPATQRIFLCALFETGCVGRAARAAGMSRSSPHRLRRRLAGTGFDRRWDQALAGYALRMTDPFAGDAARASRG